MADDRKIKGVVDIVFVLDVSGSMKPCIDALRDNLNVFVQSMVNDPQSPIRDWRAKVVGYRDATVDGSDWLVDNPFVNDADQLQKQFADLEAFGGGDEPESLLDALHVVANMGASESNAQMPDANLWRDRVARVVVVFTDATFHSTMASAGREGGTLEDLENAVSSAKIKLVIYAPTFPEFEGYYDLAAFDKSELEEIEGDDPQKALADYTADTANFQSVMKALAKTVSKTVQVISFDDQPNDPAGQDNDEPIEPAAADDDNAEDS